MFVFDLDLRLQSITDLVAQMMNINFGGVYLSAQSCRTYDTINGTDLANEYWCRCKTNGQAQDARINGSDRLNERSKCQQRVYLQRVQFQ
jgi:hypothetical protein